jgi:hypothetical protein
MIKSLPIPPPHSRWEILEEISPDLPKRQFERSFRVRCTCGSGIERELAYRYVHGESLSCGCLVREKAAEMGRSRLDPLNVGYREWLIDNAKPKGKFGPKLPNLKTLVDLKAEGWTNKEIAKKYGATSAAVSKRLREQKDAQN